MTSFHGHLRKWNVWSHFRLQDFKASDVEVDHIIIIVVVANLFFFIRSSYCFKEKGIKPTNVLSPMIPLSGKRLHRNTSEMLQLEEIRGIESKSDESKEQKKKSFFFRTTIKKFLARKKGNQRWRRWEKFLRKKKTRGFLSFSSCSILYQIFCVDDTSSCTFDFYSWHISLDGLQVNPFSAHLCERHIFDLAVFNLCHLLKLEYQRKRCPCHTFSWRSNLCQETKGTWEATSSKRK